MNNTVRFISGLLIGGVLGLGAGLLFSPSTGKQNRKKIGKKSKKLARKLAGYIGSEHEFEKVSAKRKNGKAPVEV